MNKSPTTPAELTYICQCYLCVRGRKFWRITELLPKDERIWVRQQFDAMNDGEAALEMERAWQKDSRLQEADYVHR